jgi:protein-serine/threonine kinase
MPSQGSQQQSWPEFQVAPERNPEKYGTATQNNQTKCRALAEAFFKDSVKRARDRNLRLVNPVQKLLGAMVDYFPIIFDH